ncbi:hypothetical protein OF846_001538 [Rhodotorula toruloides]|nr:hypothetical protein OF846_001538 [Rhodotorula toruloides]
MASTATSGSPGGLQELRYTSCPVPTRATAAEATSYLDDNFLPAIAKDLNLDKKDLLIDAARRNPKAVWEVDAWTVTGQFEPTASRHSRSQAPGAFQCLSVSGRCTLTHSYSWRKDVPHATTIEATAKEYYASVAGDPARSTANETFMHQQLTESQVKLTRLTNETKQARLLEANKLAIKGFGLAALQKAGNLTDAEVKMIASVWWLLETGEGGWRLSFNTLATDNPQSTRFLQRFKVPLRLRIQKAITILDKPDVPSTPFIEAMEKMVNDPELLKLRDDRNEAAHEGRDDDEQVKDIMRRYFPAEMSEKEQTVGRMLDFAKVTKPVEEKQLNAVTFITRKAQ